VLEQSSQRYDARRSRQRLALVSSNATQAVTEYRAFAAVWLDQWLAGRSTRLSSRGAVSDIEPIGLRRCLIAPILL
jgi:hypothetical protein